MLYEPWDPRVRNKSGRPFRVFTPFWRHCLTLTPPEAPCEGPRPGDLPATAGNGWPASASLADLALLPHVDWARRFSRVWQPGEAGASAALQRFTESRLLSYTERRDFPGDAGTSRLSPHLHFGEISPRQVWHAVRVAAQERGIASESWTRWQFVTELGWREFSHHLLCHFPHTAVEPLVEDFRRFPWMPVPPGALPNVAADVSDPQSPAHLRECDRMAPAKSQAAAASPGDEARRRYLAWTRGRTGYPMVDAGMRELWATGWMHNRVRMITASFLVKHLLLPWQAGAQWFWDTLVDADLAQNTLGWQWSAGCGADAAPYFRIFNPITQGEKFDPGAAYIRRWVPELKALSDKHIHHPWDVAPDLLRHAGITLGTTYPHPIVDHAAARKAALDAFATLRGEREGGADAED
ncbi:deoxyribodipyrimidine photolyase [Verrucomicrobia bacterium LW23]|nr:deoxyribodipyrimidine photolyase [Verrucomicrobia bacterium LW23]